MKEFKVAKIREIAPPLDEDENEAEIWYPFLLSNFWNLSLSTHSSEVLFIKKIKETIKFLLFTITIDYQTKRSQHMEAMHSNALRKKEAEAKKKLSLTAATKEAASKISEGNDNKTANEIIKGAVKEELKAKGVKWKGAEFQTTKQKKESTNNKNNNNNQKNNKRQQRTGPKASGGSNPSGRPEPRTIAGHKNRTLITKAGLLSKKRQLEEQLATLKQLS